MSRLSEVWQCRQDIRISFHVEKTGTLYNDCEVGEWISTVRTLTHNCAVRYDKQQYGSQIMLTGFVTRTVVTQYANVHPHHYRQVKCWDLEYNKVIRHYHGHLSAVYSLALHPTIDILVSKPFSSLKT